MAKRIKRATTRGKQKRGKATKRPKSATKKTRRLTAKRTRATKARRTPAARAKTTRAGKAKTASRAKTRSRSRTGSKVSRVAKKATSEALLAGSLAGLATALGELKQEQPKIAPEESGEKEEQK